MSVAVLYCHLLVYPHYWLLNINGNGGCRFWQPVLQVDSQPKSSGLIFGLHSSDELSELLQWLCHDDSTMCFYKSVIRSVLEYGYVVWHHLLTQAQSDKLEALQKCVICIILYPTILPYITALGYLKLESLKHRRTVADKKFFNGISQSYNCLHHLLPPPRDTELVTRLRHANKYPIPFTKTKRFCSFINFALANYVEWLFIIFCIMYIFVISGLLVCILFIIIITAIFFSCYSSGTDLTM